jgi:hypothetical protein
VIWLALQLFGLPLLLAALYPLAIQYERGGWWKVLLPFYIVAGALSAYLNWTTLALLFWDCPTRSEKTFSQRLWRLCQDQGWRGSVARPITAYLDYFDHSPPPRETLTL